MSRVVGHRDDLKAVLDLLRVGIELEGHCDYGDPPDRGDPSRVAVRAHFGDLAAVLDEWDREVERARSAPGALWRWLADSALELGITEPPFAVGSLIDLLAILTADRSRRWQLGVPRELHFEHFSDRIGSAHQLSLYLEGQMVARLEDGPAQDGGRVLKTACSLIQALFDEAQTCEPAREIGETRDSLLALKEQLLERLASEAALTGIRFSSDCPFCVRQGDGGEVVASRPRADPG
ncbi:MAG TPA: hypothetical protein VNZ01_15710 [Solirubrobacteraceae bacterium]|jgi:hypothetical protein|nr:hypothetical protein [Solirubrobacteraceae bacterium]